MAWMAAAGGMALAICAQVILSRQVWLGLAVYALALVLWLWAICKNGRLLGKLRPLPALPHEVQFNKPANKPTPWRLLLLGIGAVATVVNAMCSLDDVFETRAVVAWVVSVGTFVAAFWERQPTNQLTNKQTNKQTNERVCIGRDGYHLSWFAVAFLGVLLVGAGFRLYHLRQNPPEMGWDHQCNLEDVWDVVGRGLRPSFFYRNNGREPGYFYWTAALVWLTGLPVGFYALKLGMAVAGLLTLPGVYLMARELYGRWVGLWAIFFAAVASWPVILNRLGLRCPLAPLASAWAFYFMLRGLRTGQRNDFLLLGLTLGAGFYGYTAFGVVPLAVVLCWGVVWLRTRRSDLGRRLRWGNIALTVLSALLVFLPLGLFMLVRPFAFWKRSLWYLAYNEIPGHPLLILLHNLKNLALMFHWRGDSVALSTLKYEPVLDPILGGMMILGLVVALARMVSRCDHLTLGLLVAGAVALLPSALSLSFPEENPSVMRTSSAIPVVFALTALPIGAWTEGVARAWRRRWQWALVWAVAVVLAVGLVWVNGHRVFVSYVEGYLEALGGAG
ncbi:MAG: glycosyltransferase family 39 protein [Anaerolineae bacterium]